MTYRVLCLAVAVSVLAACSSTAPRTDAELSQAAKQGDGRAQYELARRLATQPDYPNAMHWMQQAAEQSGPLAADQQIRANAAWQVGDWYQAGLGEPKNPALATQWWQRSARLGNTHASYRLGVMCQEQHQGKLVSECLDWFEQAAKRDHADAQLVLARWYSTQPGADTDAVKWLERSAELGNRDAQYLLGERYAQGKGVAKRPDLAQRWNDKAAAQQQPDALLKQARQAAPIHGFAAYQRAANAGSAEAELWLGQAYLAGELVSADPALGRYWLELAAAHGSHEAEYQLSLQQVDREQQIHWLMRAADGGVTRAWFDLAALQQEQGELEQARASYAKAARKGNRAALYAYGEMLRLGQGGKEDYALALKQYRQAAQQGDRMAQYRMGTMREEGLGAPRNRVHAYAWLSLAATEGMPEAVQARDELEAAMTRPEVKQAQKLSEHWFGKMPSPARTS
ncbi:sel1 repeat family protein [Aeromonas sp. FDAARGOS 1405]|uniref:tetratricopeptide repeat protein n=1 Tax=unclassified Aeromonas TaxID=257493 RepID=UPI001C2270E8|nr:tetratricopeptide repeat protein [Aeromonas sp. FDAARGOS 1405]QXB28232.1 sel1 repeat family protein [Aeromonas sp. FDAARGOS 1405]